MLASPVQVRSSPREQPSNRPLEPGRPRGLVVSRAAIFDVVQLSPRMRRLPAEQPHHLAGLAHLVPALGGAGVQVQAPRPAPGARRDPTDRASPEPARRAPPARDPEY